MWVDVTEITMTYAVAGWHTDIGRLRNIENSLLYVGHCSETFTALLYTYIYNMFVNVKIYKTIYK